MWAEQQTLINEAFSDGLILSWYSNKSNVIIKEESAKCRACADDERWNFTLTNAQPWAGWDGISLKLLKKSNKLALVDEKSNKYCGILTYLNKKLVNLVFKFLLKNISDFKIYAAL